MLRNLCWFMMPWKAGRFCLFMEVGGGINSLCVLVLGVVFPPSKNHHNTIKIVLCPFCLKLGSHWRGLVPLLYIWFSLDNFPPPTHPHCIWTSSFPPSTVTIRSSKVVSHVSLRLQMCPTSLTSRHGQFLCFL